MPRRLALSGLSLLCLAVACGSALARGEGEPCFTNGTVNSTITENWRFQTSKRDRQLMQLIAGTWRSEVPNGVGGVAHTQVTYHPEGSLTFERRTCITMQGLGTSCPASIGHGYWAAHYSDGQSVFLSTNLTLSGYDGITRPGNCSGGYFRFIDRNTTTDQQGATSRRVQ